jgi:uncharacterized protein YkwD
MKTASCTSVFVVLILAFCSPLIVIAGYPPDPTTDYEWPYSSEDSVAAVQSRFNAARDNENTQLGTSIQMLTLPSQAVWDNMGDGERALWLMNRERIDRAIAPLDSTEPNVTGVAQDYAQFLMDNDLFSHDADGRTPWERLMSNPAINACHDPFMVENLAVLWGGWSLAVERAVYLWMYDDSGSAWGHRHNILWYPYNDNSGPVGKEAFLGIGRATGTHQGWADSDIIVMDVFDPCATWVYILAGDLNGNGSLGLEDAILALMFISNHGAAGPVHLDREVDQDGKIGLSDALYILQALTALR